MPRPEILDYRAYLARWRELHGLEPGRVPFLDRYYRLPYAVARPLARAGANPNLVTLAGLAIAASSVPAYLAGGRGLALGGLLALLSGLADQLDGAVAVMTGRTTVFGAIWDSAVDRVTDLVLLAGPAAWLLRNAGSGWAVAGLAAAGAALFLLEFTRARCHAVGYVTDQVVTPAERPTRVVVVGAAGVLAGFTGTPVALWAVTGWGLAALTAVSVAILLRDAYRRAGDPTTPTR